ncbi:MAG: ABC transporter permease [Gemmatimonas sp.]
MSILEWLPWERARRTAELSDELRTHLDLATADRIARGEAPAAAAANARREFGNLGLATELSRDQWGSAGMWIEQLWQDMAFALRVLRRAPAFTIAAVLTVAIGVGGSTALFSIVDATLLRPLPYPHPEQLVRVVDDYPGVGGRDVGMSIPEWHDLERSGIFSDISPCWFDNNNLSGLVRPQRVSLLIVAPNYFNLLGVAPRLGNTFDPRDPTPGFNQQAVISDGLWKRLFGGDTGVVGRVVQLDSDSYRIIGVMPRGFQAPGDTRDERGTEVWPAFGFGGAPLDDATIQSRAGLFPSAIGRLARGVTVADAQRRVDALVQSLRRQYPADYPAERDWHVRVLPLADSVAGDVGRPLLLLLGGVGVVLLIGCANIANLLLARASARGREMAVRQALGGGTSRLVRQLLTESIVLAVIGGAVGVAIVAASKHALIGVLPDSVPRVNEVAIDWRVWAFSMGASLAAGVLFGLVPALRARRVDITAVLREEGRSNTAGLARGQARHALIIVEFALSLVLLSASGLLARSMWDMLRVSFGFNPRDVTVVRTRLPYPNDASEDLYATVTEESRFVREVLRQCKTLPGVRDVALGGGAAVPLDHPYQDQTLLRVVFERAEGRSNDPLDVTGSEVTPRYFGVLGLSLKRGRLLDEHDTDASPPVVVINEAMARAFWPGQDPIGRRIKTSPRAAQWSTIVGVVADARTESLAEPVRPQVYASLYQREAKHLAIFVQGGGAPAVLERQVRDVVQSLNPSLPVFGVETLDATITASLALRRLSLVLIALFAGIALLLSAIGIYGVVAYVVSERTQEIGVRLALGAERSQVLGMVMRQELGVVIIGATGGLIGAVFLSRVLAGWVSGVRSLDPLTLTASVAVLTAVAAASCYLPARRAAGIEPVIALRG